VAAAQRCNVDQIDDEYVVLEVMCPKCGKSRVRENYRKFVCETCDFSIWKCIAGRDLLPDEVTTLLRDGRLGPLSGFRSRLGREFSAELKLKDDFTTAFDFDDAAEDDTVDPQSCDQLGPCPKCGTPVLDMPRRYVCSKALGDHAACDFKIGRQILSRPIEAGDVRQLLSHGRTDLLQGFVSRKNKRTFAAHPTMDLAERSGNLGFEFAPRKPGMAGGTKSTVPAGNTKTFARRKKGRPAKHAPGAAPAPGACSAEAGMQGGSYEPTAGFMPGD